MMRLEIDARSTSNRMSDPTEKLMENITEHTIRRGLIDQIGLPLVQFIGIQIMVAKLLRPVRFDGRHATPTNAERKMQSITPSEMAGYFDNHAKDAVQ